jgi:phosphohistidine phosphatase
MKRLLLIRHAKSSWANPLQSDFDRPLNERGEHDAPIMGERLKKAGLIPDLMIASTAKRAAQTAKHIAREIGYDTDKIEWREELYHCIPSVFEELIYSVDDAIDTLAIIAHNPGISEFAAQLDNTKAIHHMPTCAMAGFETDIDRWSDFTSAKKKTFLYDTPKKEHE